MAKEFDRYFIEKTKGNPLHEKYLHGEPSYTDWPIWLDSEVATSIHGSVEGAFHCGPHLVMKPLPAPPQGFRPHAHEFDEYLLWHGLDPDNPEELGGEVEIWLEGEHRVITKTTAVFIPAFWFHTLMSINRVDRPFLFTTIGNTLKYSCVSYDPDPKYANAYALDELVEVTFPSDGKKYEVARLHCEYMEWLQERARKNVPKRS